MIALGIWQLRRADVEGRAARRYRSGAVAAADRLPDRADRRAICPCSAAPAGCACSRSSTRATAGRNRKGETGYVAHRRLPHRRRRAGDERRDRLVGRPQCRQGLDGRAGQRGDRARHAGRGCGWCRDHGLAGLEPSAPPSTESIPNNHRSYAVQWFLFARIALLIYGLALREPPGRQARGTPDVDAGSRPWPTA